MVNDSMVISGNLPDMTLLMTDREPIEGEPQPTPGAPQVQQPPEDSGIPGEIGGGADGQQRPGEEEVPDEGETGKTGGEDEKTPEPEETEEAGETEETTGEDNEEASDSNEKEEDREAHTEVAEECTHGVYPYVCIGTGILSLALIVTVVLMALRCRSFKKRITQLSNRKSQILEAAAPIPAAPSDKIQVGKVHEVGAREYQQDCLAVSPLELYSQKGLLALVADGMGGLTDGDRMSQAAANAILSGFISSRDAAPADLLLALTAEANQAVNRLLGPQNQGRSGTTLVAGLVKNGLFHYISVGDSRICLYRQGMLTQLNREHDYKSELAVQAINGVGTVWDANTHPKAAALTSFLGMGNLKYVDIPAEPVKLRGGDKIILMSDGVYNALSVLELENALAQPAQKAAETITQMIQGKAFRTQDNYTAVVLEF